MKVVLKEWWARFRAVEPDHGYFAHAEQHQIPLEQVVPFLSHADDGRSYKHLGIWILSSAGALGRGLSRHVEGNRHKEPLKENGMGANFLGQTWTTQYMFTSVLKTYYSKYKTLIDDLTAIYAEDVGKLFTEGVTSANGEKVYLAHMGMKGDLPMLSKMGNFKRCWTHVPRQASSRKQCSGICHLCLAGREGNPAYPFEDVRPGAAWTTTLFQEVAWPVDSPPKILQSLPLSAKDQMNFFNSDIWHNWHLGMSKHFLGSAFVALVENNFHALPAGSVDVKFAALTDMYLKFHRERKCSPFLGEISRDTMTFPASTATPIGRWSKAQVSTELMLFLDHLGSNYIKGQTHDELFTLIVPRYLLSITAVVFVPWCLVFKIPNTVEKNILYYQIWNRAFGKLRRTQRRLWTWRSVSCSRLAFGSRLSMQRNWVFCSTTSWPTTPSVQLWPWGKGCVGLACSPRATWFVMKPFVCCMTAKELHGLLIQWFFKSIAGGLHRSPGALIAPSKHQEHPLERIAAMLDKVSAWA